jgi:hypothetical protein
MNSISLFQEEAMTGLCKAAAPAKTGRVFVASVDGDLFATELSIYARMVWLALRTFADDEGTCWPSVVTLSQKLGMSERQVQRCLRELEVNGRLQVSGQSYVRSNRYQLAGVGRCNRFQRKETQESPLSVEDSVAMPKGDTQSPIGCTQVTRTLISDLESVKKEREKERDSKPSFFLEDQPGQNPPV